MNKKQIKNIVVGVVVCAIIVGIIGGALAVVKKNRTNSLTAEVKQVSTLAVDPDMWSDSSTSYATVSTEYTQSVYADSSKNISEIYVKEGDSVKIGDKLLSYDKTLLELQEQSAKITVQKDEIAVNRKKEALEKLKNTTPVSDNSGGGYIDETTPEPEPTATPLPDSHANLYSKVTLDAVPYAGTGTVDDPYRYLITEDCVIRKEFIAKVYGFVPAATATPEPTATPTPTAEPTTDPTIEPDPTSEPTAEPTAEPTIEPTVEPTVEPTAEPTVEPTVEPTEIPSPDTSTETASIGAKAMNFISGLFPKVVPLTTTEESSEASSEASSESSATSTQMYTTRDGNPVSYDKPFCAVFELRLGDNENGELIKAWKFDGVNDETGFYTIDIPDGDEDEESSDTETDEEIGINDFVYYGGTVSTEITYTADELKQAISDAEDELSNAELQLKTDKIAYEKAKLALDNATVLSEVNGVVKSVLEAEAATEEGKPIMTVSGAQGTYIKGTISEDQLGTVKVGDSFAVGSWDTGKSYEGKVLSISEFPVESTADSSYFSDHSQSKSSYQFVGLLDGGDDLSDGSYLSLKFTSSSDDSSSGGIYLSQMYLRTDNGGTYLYKAVDGRLKKTYVETGKILYDYYIQVTSNNLSSSDWVAFPYGDNIQDGVKCVDSDGNAITQDSSSDTVYTDEEVVSDGTDILVDDDSVIEESVESEESSESVSEESAESSESVSEESTEAEG